MKIKLFAAIAAAATFASGAAPAAAGLKTAVFAGGCFWSMEKGFESTAGVVSAVSGYSGGTMSNPTYHNHPGYLEAVKVTYDPAKISYAQLVDSYYHHIDPTDPNGQICDFGPSYRLAVFVADGQEQKIADAAKAKYGKELGATITVATRQASRFWDAEDYHQDYAKKNPAAYQRYYVGCGRGPALHAVWNGKEAH